MTGTVHGMLLSGASPPFFFKKKKALLVHKTRQLIGAKARAQTSRQVPPVSSQGRVVGVDYIVLTMVDRDDMADGGSGHVAQTIAAIKRLPAAFPLGGSLGPASAISNGGQMVCSSI